MLTESARMASAAEARFRVQAPNSRPRAVIVVALDASAEPVVRRLAGEGWRQATFAAIAAKKQDPSATVTLLTREHCEPYEKPPLSKAVLLGRASPDDAPIAGPRGIGGHDVVLERLARCTAIDRAAQAVLSDD